MEELEIRWAARESRTPMARPFGVLFSRGDGLTLTGVDLLYYGSFQAAVLDMLGRVVTDEAVEAAGDPQRAWLDRLAGLLPATVVTAVERVDAQDPLYGLHHLFDVIVAGGAGSPPPRLDAPTLLDYQATQAAVAHQAGGLLRLPGVEAVDDPRRRRRAWLAVVDGWLGDALDPATLERR